VQPDPDASLSVDPDLSPASHAGSMERLSEVVNQTLPMGMVYRFMRSRRPFHVARVMSCIPSNLCTAEIGSASKMPSRFDMTPNALKSSLWLSKSIAPSRRGRHDNHMRSGRITPMIPNLFSTEPPREQAALTPTPTTPPIENSAASSRHVLPSDLPAAIKHLSDQQLEQLHVAVAIEQQRRGKKPLPSKIESRRTELAAVTLTIGKQNAVRAAFKAGVTPAKIAKQFGIPQSDVRRVIANETMKQ
jgi:hypothetical protein